MSSLRAAQVARDALCLLNGNLQCHVSFKASLHSALFTAAVQGRVADLNDHVVLG